MTTTHSDQLQLAERWGVSPQTLERWRVIGTGPKFIRLPGKVIYRLCDIEVYENECLVSSTAEFRKAKKWEGSDESSLPPTYDYLRSEGLRPPES